MTQGIDRILSPMRYGHRRHGDRCSECQPGIAAMIRRKLQYNQGCMFIQEDKVDRKSDRAVEEILVYEGNSRKYTVCYDCD